jgi:hypothetical protein
LSDFGREKQPRGVRQRFMICPEPAAPPNRRPLDPPLPAFVGQNPPDHNQPAP